MARCGSDARRRAYTSEVTFWAFLAQVLSEDGSCARAVAGVQSWFCSHGIEPPSCDNSSYCKARRRLPEQMLEAIHRRLVSDLGRRTHSGLLWCGHNVKAIDGTTVQLPDTPENQREYPQPEGQKEGCGFPVMQLAGLINLCHGGFEQFVVSGGKRHDHVLLGSVLDHIGADEVLVGDRAFCSYEMFARSAGQESWMLVRLHQKRKVNWRKGKRIGREQRVVRWKRPQQSGRSTLSPDQWADLPGEMDIRLVRVKTIGRDGKRKVMYLATNLLDPVRYEAEDFAALYFQRWEIELRFRDLKTTMRMEKLRTKTPEMARKEAAMFVIAYNAVRSLILLAACGADTNPWRISFKGALQVLDTFRPLFRNLHHRPLLRAQMLTELLLQIAGRQVPERPGRQEPRAVKSRPKPFPLLNAPRHEYREILHRSTYRKPADKAA